MKHVPLECLHLVASIVQYEHPVMNLKAYELGLDGRSSTEQAPRYTGDLYTVQGCQCEGQGSLDVLVSKAIK